MLDQTNRRFLYGFLIVSALGACGYDAPSVSGVPINASSSSSSGMGGIGGMGGAGESSSSAEGSSGVGLIPMGGMGGIGVGGFGVGGDGGKTTTTSSSSSSSGGGSGSVADPIVSDCGDGDCHTMPILSICCKAKAIGGSSDCKQASGVCLNTGDYALECDDKADCGSAASCCMEGDRAECKTDCMGMIVCKTKDDCPPASICAPGNSSVSFCIVP